MLTSPFFRGLFLSYLILICAAIGIVGFVGAQQLRSSYLERARQSLRDETQLLARILASDLRANRAAELQAQVRQLGQLIPRRITVVAGDGTVMADNEADPSQVENHRLRPEIATATSRGEGESIRPSDTVHADLMYFARRVESADGQPYYLRVSVHLTELDRHLRVFYTGIALAAGLAMLGAAMICYYIARRTARPLVELTRFADALRQGDLSHRVLRRESGEVGTLSTALNSMADSLTRLISEAQQDKAQLLTVLSSMSEGIIATDAQQRILFSNSAATRLLAFPVDQSAGKLLWEAVRSQPILQGVSETLRTHDRRSLQVGPIAGRHLNVTICSFQASTGGEQSAPAPEGVVIVMHDATEAVRYQELRKEFVANVSHELRTPLTAIKGFAETLRDGAMHDPQRGPQYLATIEKHAEQLTNLVTDLLDLSRLESLPGLPRLAPVDLVQIARKVADLFLPAAQGKRQQLRVEIGPNLPLVNGNADYLERAVSNLVDNAVKYTPEEGAISISVKQDEGGLVVEVADNGIGIPSADLLRIFERFYRVDRSRSRDMGGTGLGLSIVKHIAQAHRGEVEVASVLGQGTKFSLWLPIASSSSQKKCFDFRLKQVGEQKPSEHRS